MWRSSTSGLQGNIAPIPLQFSIPEGFSQSTNKITLVDDSTVSFAMNPPLIIPDGCSIDLNTASYAYSQPNVAAAGEVPAFINGNNRVTITFGANPPVDVLIPRGLYDYTDVAYQLNLYARTVTPTPWIVAGGADLFVFQGISSTQQLSITLNPAGLFGGIFPSGGVTLSFINPSIVSPNLSNSMGDLLGFGTSTANQIVGPSLSSIPKTVISPFAAGFSDTSAYVLYMSIVTNSYSNGLTGQLLYSFPLGNETPNSVVGYQASLRYPVPVNSGNFSSVQIWTTDQEGNKLPWKYYQSPFQFTALISKIKADGSV